ncbi:FliO/MopB family protein [Caldicellulosiruptor naganoensis]|uniref:Flagellar biosynthetic protein FliO n=1 Tax=Caldicellulosiruptor naganoensis TaxID=29324 RepID=A0ABY7BI81_9FIRM|nr:flagellar biosynthetic protein FliO [Caldicellulosiruptor naganoensis]WAM32113.1 flagellar biosynthetic protein FliO [Caldicellulosiruptor naganoensis]
MELILRIVGSLLLIGVLIYLTYFVLKVYSKKAILRKGEFMKIVDVLPLSSDSMLVLIKAGQKYILLGKTQKSITFLKEFELSEFSEVNEISDEKSFKKIFDNSLSSSFGLKDKVLSLYNMIKDKDDEDKR